MGNKKLCNLSSIIIFEVKYYFSIKRIIIYHKKTFEFTDLKTLAMLL